jgi:hypothetical protein
VGLYQINESVASLKEGKPPDLFAVGLLLGFGRIEVRQHFIQRLIVEINQLPQGVAFLTPRFLFPAGTLLARRSNFSSAALSTSANLWMNCSLGKSPKWSFWFSTFEM